ncbi:MAG TPA: hypothetical protein VFV99_32930 [Kofleriaceae bacterium]|nr:hypothetical protein [Kofleriaceae bacterium]
MNFETARVLADAVLMEGYALYPYRASSLKNRFRWTFGVLAPRAWAKSSANEPWWLQVQVLVAGPVERIAGRLRFFQIERRHADEGSTITHWDEGVLREVDFVIEDGRTCVPFAFDGGWSRTGTEARERRAIVGDIVLERERVSAEDLLTKLSIRVENHTPWSDQDAPRDRVMIAALASTHLLLGVDSGHLLSALDPPAWARNAAICTNVRAYPILVGPEGSGDVVLAGPFIMQDYPQIAPESAGDLCDATEIDELLMLRTRTMTDAEKREARATDARAAAIIDRADGLPAEWLARMHGAARSLSQGEMIPKLPPLAVGSKVRLRAPTTRTDAQDLLYAGQVATVVELREDVDGTTFLGVTVDADPAAELHRWYGRCHYYRVDEVEPL